MIELDDRGGMAGKEEGIQRCDLGPVGGRGGGRLGMEGRDCCLDRIRSSPTASQSRLDQAGACFDLVMIPPGPVRIP